MDLAESTLTFATGTCGRNIAYKAKRAQFERALALEKNGRSISLERARKIWMPEVVLADSMWGRYLGIESYKDIEEEKKAKFPKALIRLEKVGNGAGARKILKRGEYLVRNYLDKKGLGACLTSSPHERVFWTVGTLGATGTAFLKYAPDYFEAAGKYVFAVIVAPDPKKDSYRFKLAEPIIEEFEALARKNGWNYIKVFPFKLLKPGTSYSKTEIIEIVNESVARGLQGILEMHDLLDPSTLALVLGDEGGPIRVGSFVFPQRNEKVKAKEKVEQIESMLKVAFMNQLHHLGEKKAGLGSSLIVLDGKANDTHIQIIKDSVEKLKKDEEWMKANPNFDSEVESIGMPVGDVTAICITGTNKPRPVEEDEKIALPWFQTHPEEEGAVTLGRTEALGDQLPINESLVLTALDSGEETIQDGVNTTADEDDTEVKVKPKEQEQITADPTEPIEKITFEQQEEKGASKKEIGAGIERWIMKIKAWRASRKKKPEAPTKIEPVPEKKVAPLPEPEVAAESEKKPGNGHTDTEVTVRRPRLWEPPKPNQLFQWQLRQKESTEEKPVIFMGTIKDPLFTEAEIAEKARKSLKKGN